MPVPDYPERAVARDEAAAKEFKACTLAKLCNDLPQWLVDAHAALGAAVAAAYRWDAGISEDDVLRELPTRNPAGREPAGQTRQSTRKDRE